MPCTDAMADMIPDPESRSRLRKVCDILLEKFNIDNERYELSLLSELKFTRHVVMEDPCVRYWSSRLD